MQQNVKFLEEQEMSSTLDEPPQKAGLKVARSKNVKQNKI